MGIGERGGDEKGERKGRKGKKKKEEDQEKIGGGRENL